MERADRKVGGRVNDQGPNPKGWILWANCGESKEVAKEEGWVYGEGESV